MRPLLLAFALALPTVLSAAGSLAPLVSREAAQCAGAWQREDIRRVIDYMPPRVVQRLGGRAALERELRQHFADARQLGAERLEVMAGMPSTPQQIGPWIVASMPITAIVRGTYVDLTQDTQALALSSDRGRRWSFLLLYDVEQAEFDGWFPELRGRVRVPVSPKPRLTLAK